MISIGHLIARVAAICLFLAFLSISNGIPPIEPLTEPLDSYYDKETDIIKIRILKVRAETLGIKRGEDVEYVGSKDGRTLLMDCAAFGTKDDIRKLILYGAKVNAKDKKGRTPLIAAAYKGRVDAIKLLLQAGAKVDMGDNQGWTPLMYAVAHGRYGAVKELIKGKADLYADCFGKPILYWAKGDVKMIELLCLAGARVNALDSHGWTPLMYAAYGGDVEAAKALVKGGVNTEIVLKNGHIPLTYFTSEKNLKAVKTLIKAGANLNAREKYTKNQITALLWAVDQGYTEIAKVLIQAGADVNVRDKGEREYTPLLLAADRGYTEIAKALIQAGADVNAVSKEGASVMYWAQRNGLVELVNILRNAGAW